MKIKHEIEKKKDWISPIFCGIILNTFIGTVLLLFSHEIYAMTPFEYKIKSAVLLTIFVCLGLTGLNFNLWNNGWYEAEETEEVVHKIVRR